MQREYAAVTNVSRVNGQQQQVNNSPQTHVLPQDNAQLMKDHAPVEISLSNGLLPSIRLLGWEKGLDPCCMELKR